MTCKNKWVAIAGDFKRKKKVVTHCIKYVTTPTYNYTFVNACQELHKYDCSLANTNN